MREEIMEILTELRPDVEFENEKKLIDDGILDSFDIVSLVGELNDAFDVSINEIGRASCRDRVFRAV